MAQPMLTSDEEILRAAARLIAERVAEASLLDELAAQLGISKSALVLRFRSAHALKVASLRRLVDRFAASLDTLPQTPGGDNLLRLAAFIGGKIHKDNSARTFANFSANVHEPELHRLEIRRGELLSCAISKVMPAVAIPHAAAILAFRSHLIGSIRAWLDTGEGNPQRYLLERTRDWLILSQVGFQDELVEALATAHAEAQDVV